MSCARPPRVLRSFVAGALLGACGVAAPTDYRPATATIHGVLNVDEAPPGASHIRAALVWESSETTVPNRPLRAQNVRLTADWPAFTIGIDAVPPDEATISGESSRWARGRVIVFRDVNQNDALDFTSIQADWFEDELVAFPHRDYVDYWESNGPSGQSAGFTVAGSDEADASLPIIFNLSRRASASCHLLDWMPRSAHEAAQHSHPDPTTGDQGPWDLERIMECDDVVPPPGTERVACDPINALHPDFMASWSAPTSPFVANTCGPVMRICQRRRDIHQPAPAGWPCPCDPTKYACVDYWSGL